MYNKKQRRFGPPTFIKQFSKKFKISLKWRKTCFQWIYTTIQKFESVTFKKYIFLKEVKSARHSFGQK